MSPFFHLLKGLYFNATSTEYVLDGLQPSTRYSVYVRGVIDGNRRRTARSNFVYFTTLAGPGELLSSL